MQIIQLRRSLLKAQDRIADLENAVEDLMVRRDGLERDRSEQILRMGSVLEKVGVIDAAMKDISKALEAITALCRNEPPVAADQSASV